MESSLDRKIAPGQKKDRLFVSGLKKSQALLIRMAEQLVVPWFRKEAPFLPFQDLTYFDKDAIVSSFIFLTEKKRTPEIENLLSWFGIHQERTSKNMFNGEVRGVLKPHSNIALEVHLFHFDHMPVRLALEPHSSLKIVVVDSDYEKSYKNSNLAWQMLPMDTSVLLVFDINEDSVTCFTTHLGRKKKIKTFLNIYSEEVGFGDVLEGAQVASCLQWVKNHNNLKWVKEVYGMLGTQLQQTEEKLKGRVLRQYLNKKREANEQEGKLSLKERVKVKNSLESYVKRQVKFIDDQTENFDKESREYVSLLDEISSFHGFVETKYGKNLSLQISDGAIAHFSTRATQILNDFFKETEKSVGEKRRLSENEMRDQLSKILPHVPAIEFPLQAGTPAPKKESTIIEKPDKTYERQISTKGIGSLLMELRTPMFMLMPFMMIFALFGALVGEQDSGTIDDSVFFYNNRPCIMITTLPEARGEEYLTFINDIDEARSERKGVFNKEISSELLSEPQLAVVTKEVQGAYGNKPRLEKTLDFHFDRKTKNIYVFLNDTSDREFVVSQLMDPQNKLLSMPSNTRRGFGIGGMIRALSGLKDYKYIILIGLSGLVVWFIVTRKVSMDHEVKKSKLKEKQKLITELKQFIDKGIKSAMQKWRVRIQDEMMNNQKRALNQIELEWEKQIAQQNKGALESKRGMLQKEQQIKTEKSLLAKLKTEQIKVKTGLEKLEYQLKGKRRA